MATIPVKVIKRKLCLPFLPKEMDQEGGVDGHVLICSLWIIGQGVIRENQ